MDGSPAPTVVTTIPSFTTTPRPSHMTFTVSTVDDALPFVDANISAYGVDNPASPNNYVIVPYFLSNFDTSYSININITH